MAVRGLGDAGRQGAPAVVAVALVIAIDDGVVGFRVASSGVTVSEAE